MSEVLVGLGTNVGDRVGNLMSAYHHLREQFDVLAASRIYETEPMYVTDQAAFLNAAVRIRSSLGPLPILRALKSLEWEMGREQRQRYGPREIDLDMLSYGCLQYRHTEGDKVVLQVPHPRIPERRFVLAPLSDIAANLYLPGLGVVSHLLERTNSQAASVVVVEDAVFPI